MSPTGHDVLLYDKSTLESLSASEAPFLDMLYFPMLVPTLVYEVLADLTKPHVRKAPAEHVRAMARRFGGSGPAVNESYRDLMITELVTGNAVPMNGQIIAQGMSVAPDADGELAGLVDLTPFNHALLRWSAGKFLPEDLDLAMRWRKSTRDLNLLRFHAELRARNIDVPRPRDEEHLGELVGALLARVSEHRAWLQFLLSELDANPTYRSAALRRWDMLEAPSLATFSPYSFFCLRALLLVMFLWVHGLTKNEPNNLIDVQYLYYLPFCDVFSSRDKLHKKTARLLLRPDQTFLWADELRAQIKERMALRANKGPKAG
jgi:hypothetical protein